MAVTTLSAAIGAYKETAGALPCRVTILFEGEEESGSPSLKPFLEANAAELTADFALVCDTSMWDADTPAISAISLMPIRSSSARGKRLIRYR